MPKYVIDTSKGGRRLGRHVLIHSMLPEFSYYTSEQNARKVNYIRENQFGQNDILENTICSGSGMESILNSDLFRNNLGRQLGSRPYGLSDYISELNHYYPNCWKAGHLLNQDFGGQGDSSNLTPLTTYANRNHAIFEQHIRQIGQAIINFESHEYYRYSPYWFCIQYNVYVSEYGLLEDFDPGNILNGVHSHISINYDLVRYRKDAYVYDAVFDENIQEMPIIPNLEIFNDNTIRNFSNEGNCVYAQIHNCPEHFN